MPTINSIPQARVVRKGGQHFPPLPIPQAPSALREQLYATLHVLVGLWPLTAIVLFAAGLLIIAGHNGAP